MKRSLILILLIFPSYCFPAGNSKENTCGPNTFYADMKGDGGKEAIILVNEKLEGQDQGCHFKSLKIYEKNKIVFEETIKLENEANMESREISIERFHKGDKEMIFYRQHNCSNCNPVFVLGFMKAKYQTVLFNAATGGEVIDLEGDGNKEIVVDPHGYYGSMPTIHDYDPIKDEFINSGSKHPKFYRDLIKESEAEILKFPESGNDCCTRTANLEMIEGAAATLGDNDLLNKTKDRLSVVYVEYGKAYYSKNDFRRAISAYKTAVKNNSSNYEAFNYLGYSYFRNHEFKEAVDSLENSIAINPSYVEGHYNLALAYWSSEERTKAIYEIKSILKFDPSYKDKIKDDTQFKVFKSSKEFRTLIMH